MIVGNNILIEKRALTEQMSDSFFGILAEQFPEFASEDQLSAIAKTCRMLCRFTCVNCMDFSEVGNHYVLFSGHFNFPLQSIGVTINFVVVLLLFLDEVTIQDF